MNISEAKELERLKSQEAVTARLKLRDGKQKEIDRAVDRRSGGWHAARAELAFSFISDDVEDKIAIRKDMASRCPELASPYEMKQFEENLSSAIESGFQAVIKGLSVMGVRVPASTLSEVSTRKHALRQRIHAAARMMQLEAPKPVPVAPAPIQGNTKPVPSSYRFQIALSFPGESRARVEQIAENLTASVPKESILYDKWLASELARPNLDLYLTDLYKKDSLLLVFFLSGHYAQKEWCGLEWRVGRDLLKQKQEQRLMPLRLDDAEIPGLHSIDGYLDIRDLSDAQVSSAILERLAALSDGQHFPVQATIPEPSVENEIPDAPEYWNQRCLLGTTPIFTEIQQRPRWCIWVRPAQFKRARFRNLDQCANFMRSFSRGRNRYPVFFEDSLERGDEWIACEHANESERHSYLQRWVLLRSAQFVQNLALERQIELGDRTHVLEILDRVTVAYECAAAMAKGGGLSGNAALTFSFYNVDGRQLTWPKDLAGYENHVDPDSWCEDHKFEFRRVVTADRLIPDGRALALDTAMAIYSGFRWSDPPKTLLQSMQMQRFGQMIP